MTFTSSSTCLFFMVRGIHLLLYHPVPQAVPSHMGRRRRHGRGRWDEQERQLRARAEPIPVLRSCARALSSCVTGSQSWERVLEAACVLYAICTLHPGILDLVALFVGAFEFFIGRAPPIQCTSVGLAVSPSTVCEALRWCYGSASTAAWRAPRLHFARGSGVDVVGSLFAPLWDRGPFNLWGSSVSPGYMVG